MIRTLLLGLVVTLCAGCTGPRGVLPPAEACRHSPLPNCAVAHPDPWDLR